MEDLLNAVTAKLAEAPSIQYSDENWGQLLYYGKECPVKWPCGLVDFTTGQFSNIGSDYRQSPEMRQQGTIFLEITIANLKLTNSSVKAPINQKQKAFEILAIVEEVHKVLQGFRPLDNSGAMVRTSIQTVKRDDGVQEKRVIYSVGLNDC